MKVKVKVKVTVQMKWSEDKVNMKTKVHSFAKVMIMVTIK